MLAFLYFREFLKNSNGTIGSCALQAHFVLNILRANHPKR